jgi:hypothetical protein
MELGSVSTVRVGFYTYDATLSTKYMQNGVFEMIIGLLSLVTTYNLSLAAAESIEDSEAGSSSYGFFSHKQPGSTLRPSKASATDLRLTGAGRDSDSFINGYYNSSACQRHGVPGPEALSLQAMSTASCFLAGILIFSTGLKLRCVSTCVPSLPPWVARCMRARAWSRLGYGPTHAA